MTAKITAEATASRGLYRTDRELTGSVFLTAAAADVAEAFKRGRGMLRARAAGKLAPHIVEEADSRVVERALELYRDGVEAGMTLKRACGIAAAEVFLDLQQSAHEHNARATVGAEADIVESMIIDETTGRQLGAYARFGRTEGARYGRPDRVASVSLWDLCDYAAELVAAEDAVLGELLKVIIRLPAEASNDNTWRAVDGVRMVGAQTVCKVLGLKITGKVGDKNRARVGKMIKDAVMAYRDAFERTVALFGGVGYVGTGACDGACTCPRHYAARGMSMPFVPVANPVDRPTAEAGAGKFNAVAGGKRTDALPAGMRDVMTAFLMTAGEESAARPTRRIPGTGAGWGQRFGNATGA